MATEMRDTKDDIGVKSPQQVEFAEEDLKKPQGKVDYSGAQEKTDPREIALVKKLDRWIMVSLPPAFSSNPPNVIFSPCCGPCTGSTILTAMPLPWRV